MPDETMKIYGSMDEDLWYERLAGRVARGEATTDDQSQFDDLTNRRLTKLPSVDSYRDVVIREIVEQVAELKGKKAS